MRFAPEDDGYTNVLRCKDTRILERHFHIDRGERLGKIEHYIRFM